MSGRLELEQEREEELRTCVSKPTGSRCWGRRCPRTWMSMGERLPSGSSFSITKGAATYCCLKMMMLGLTPSSREKSASNREPACGIGSRADGEAESVLNLPFSHLPKWVLSLPPNNFT